MSKEQQQPQPQKKPAPPVPAKATDEPALDSPDAVSTLAEARPRNLTVMPQVGELNYGQPASEGEYSLNMMGRRKYRK